MIMEMEGRAMGREMITEMRKEVITEMGREKLTETGGREMEREMMM